MLIEHLELAIQKLNNLFLIQKGYSPNIDLLSTYKLNQSYLDFEGRIVVTILVQSNTNHSLYFRFHFDVNTFEICDRDNVFGNNRPKRGRMKGAKLAWYPPQ